MLGRSAMLAALTGGLTVAGQVGCAPTDSQETPAPPITATAQIPPLEVHVDAPRAPSVPTKPTERVAAKPKPETRPKEPPPVEAAAPTKPVPRATTPDAPAAPQTAYEPPFPNRTDLFVPPKRAGGASAQSAGDNAVLLMGFVRVDQPKAVLSINGEIAPMAAGESRFGVDVVSIAPPHVVLQRGRQRWQTTLE